MAKKIPMRMCVSCRERFAKKDLIRVVATPDGQTVIDPTGRMAGRGAYVCHDPECMKKALDRKQFDKGLKTKVDLETIRPELEKLSETQENSGAGAETGDVGKNKKSEDAK
ncbi:MAG: YlxR family protein [Clostridiales bacterium]|nr:YlxR family protein [Clostridiales bacterium]